MPEQTTNGMQCQEFDILLAEALDGALAGERLDRFQAHRRDCPACGPLFGEAEAGLNWLRDLREVEPPAGLVENILLSTTGVVSNRLGHFAPSTQPRVSWMERLQAWAVSSMEPVWATVRQPRFAMSFGMAFFSLSVALSVAGVKPADLSQISLRPSAVRRTYYATQARIVRYYENIRFVYEVESRVREVKRIMTPTEPASAPAKQKERKNDTSKEPEQKQERNYSQFDSRVVLASVPLGPSVNDLPVVSVTTYRRFV
jgi:Putative zinc-finger